MRYRADVMLKDANGMETSTTVEVEADDLEAAKELAREAAADQMEFTGEHAWIVAEVKDHDIHPADEAT